MENTNEMLDLLGEMIAVYGVKILAAIAIFFIGRIVAKWLRRLIKSIMEKNKADALISGFVSNLVYIGLMVFVVLASLGQLGIETTSFIAVIGAAGLAIGLALQGTLANFAAGFLLVIFKPFKVGDFIEGAGVAGTVEMIESFTTTLKTGDNKIVIIPNAQLSNNNIINYSAKDTRRVDMVFGVSYDADIKQVKEVLTAVVNSDQRVLTDPAPLIAVSELADNSVNFNVRVWGKTSDYWGILFSMTEAVKLQFDAAGIGMPYPQRDVHLYDHTASDAAEKAA